jgi:hypothetical protein
MTGTRVSAVTAYTAHKEWASRPPDERYASVHALYEAARARRQQLEERTIETGDFRTEAVDDDLAFRESSGRTSELWVHASLDQRQRLQQLFFPEGVPFDGKRFSRTAVNAAAFSYLRPIQQGNENLVDLTGIEPVTS